MKTLQSMALLSLIFTSSLTANGGAQSTDIKRSSAAVEETYTDELQTKKAAPDRTEQTREKMKENPRNLSYPGSFGQIDSHEDDQERQEDKDEKQSRFLEEMETIDQDTRY